MDKKDESTVQTQGGLKKLAQPCEGKAAERQECSLSCLEGRRFFYKSMMLAQ